MYLLGIIASLVCIGLIDCRFRLAFFYDRRRTLLTVAVGVLLFIIWDILGIALGIFYIGNSTLLTGVQLGSEFPIEELFFLIFLCYQTLVLYQGMRRITA